MNNNVHDAIQETEKLLQGLEKTNKPTSNEVKDSTPAFVNADEPSPLVFKSSEIPPPQDKDYPGDQFLDCTSMYTEAEFDAFRRLDIDFYSKEEFNILQNSDNESSETPLVTSLVDFFENSNKWEEISSKDLFASSSNLENTEVCSYENLIDESIFIDGTSQTKTKVVWDWMMIACTLMFMSVAGFFMWPLNNLGSIVVLLATSFLFLTCFRLEHQKVTPTLRLRLVFSLNNEIIVKEKVFKKKALTTKTS